MQYFIHTLLNCLWKLSLWELTITLKKKQPVKWWTLTLSNWFATVRGKTYIKDRRNLKIHFNQYQSIEYDMVQSLLIIFIRVEMVTKIVLNNNADYPIEIKICWHQTLFWKHIFIERSRSRGDWNTYWVFIQWFDVFYISWFNSLLSWYVASRRKKAAWYS